MGTPIDACLHCLQRGMDIIHEVSPELLAWLMFRTHVSKGAWANIKLALPSKRALGTLLPKAGLSLPKRFRTQITVTHPEPIIQLIRQHNGPEELCEMCVDLIADHEDRYRVAVKYQLFDKAILVSHKDLMNLNYLTELANTIHQKLGETEKSKALRERIIELQKMGVSPLTRIKGSR